MPNRPEKVERPWLIKGKQKKVRKPTQNDPFYNSGKWRREAALHRRTNPLCIKCKERGIYTKADITDHIIPIKERPDLALVRTNLQSLCRACHNRKTAKEK